MCPGRPTHSSVFSQKCKNDHFVLLAANDTDSSDPYWGYRVGKTSCSEEGPRVCVGCVAVGVYLCMCVYEDFFPSSVNLLSYFFRAEEDGKESQCHSVFSKLCSVEPVQRLEAPATGGRRWIELKG